MQENLKEGFLGQSQRDTRNYDIYGDRRRSAGDTVADLGGGNTAVTPDTQTLINGTIGDGESAEPGSHGRSSSGWNSWIKQQVLDCLLKLVVWLAQGLGPYWVQQH